jgi:putative ABC transport system permease protein
MMETLLQDLRYGVRMLRKSPMVTLVAVISLALGIGANTVIFSVINAILLKALPFHDPERIALVWGNIPAEGKDRSQVSATDVDDWRQQNTLFEDVTTFGNWSATLLGEGESERIQGIQVGDGYFSIMRATPLLGRTFLPEEQQDGKDSVIVLGYGLWQGRFGGDPNIVGQKINLSGRPYTVVGVLPADFQPLPTSLVNPRGDFYRPVAETRDENERSSRHLRAIARLKQGVTLEQAQAEMNVIAGRLEQQHPRDNTGYGVRLLTLPEDTVGGLRKTLLTLFGAVAFVLLIACANVGNLLLARATGRQKEIAIRRALGAARLRLARQLLTESVLLAIIGGGLGLLLSLWGTSLVETLGSGVTPLPVSIKIDPRVLGFTFALSILTGIVFGLAPALHASNPDLNETLKEAGRSSGAQASRNRLRGVLVMSEVAMALVLLISAGLLIKSVMRLRNVNPGFKAENRLTMNVVLPSAKYPKAPQWIAFYNQLGERLNALPGVESAGFTSVLPFSANFDGRALVVEDHPRPAGEEFDVDLYIVTPPYLQTMAIPLLQGRTLTEQDSETTPLVALINEPMASEMWPGQDPIGKRFKFPGSAKSPQPWRTVIGIVGGVKQYALDRKDPMQIYLPEAQFPTNVMTLVVHTASDPKGLIAAVRNQISEMDKDQAVYNIATMEQLLADSISLRRFSTLLLMSFAAVALMLAGVGIYGVISYSVTQRTHEIGVRMALGASRRDIIHLVVRQGMTMTLAGVSIGLVATFALTRVMETLLFNVSATDPATFVIIPVALTIVALGACFVPAQRAAKVDPMEALRYE